MNNDFKKYQKKFVDPTRPEITRNKQPQIDDLLAIQQIEIDRGNYNKDYIRPAIEPKSNKSRPAVEPKSKKSNRNRKNDRNRNSPQKNGRNRAHLNQPMIHQNIEAMSQRQPATSHRMIHPGMNHNRLSDDDGTGSVESFGEFHSPKATVPSRRLVIISR